MTWDLKEFTPDQTESWDAFVLAQPHGSIHQCALWREFQQTIPGREEVLGFYALDENKEWIGAVWCVKMSTGFFRAHWYYSARGPVLKNQDPQFKIEFLAAIAKELKLNNGLFWRLYPYWQETTWTTLESQKSELSIKPATKNFQPTDSLMLSLDLSEDELLSQTKRQARKALRLANDAGVEIEVIDSAAVTAQHIESWDALNQDTTKRDGFFGHDKTYYHNFIKVLKPYSYLCLAHHENKTVAAAILTVCHDKAIYYFGASSSDPTTRDLRAPYALQWAMILKAKALGAKTYDFTGITPENEPNHPYKGITQFKTRFGGYRDTYANGREIVLNKTWYTIYRWVKKLRP
jgi:lipid II:glycine glycyltransferase (peptidoglycan interpeptide bridge formation enzyme)